MMEKSLQFAINVSDEAVLGYHEFIIEVHSDIMKLEPHHFFTIAVKVLPCFVKNLDKHN